jgi:hypothetical protein
MRFALLVCLTAFLCPGGRAQQTQAAEFPEIDAYVGITDRYRLMLMVSRSTDGSTVNSAQFGPNLDINFRPLLRKRLRTNDIARKQGRRILYSPPCIDNTGVKQR